MASGFSLSEIGTEDGCFLNGVGFIAGTGAGADAGAGAGAVAVRGGASLRGCEESVRSMGASCATVAVGVMGETGGRSEVGDSERFCEAPDVDDASLDDVPKSVFTNSAGMAAEGKELKARGP